MYILNITNPLTLILLTLFTVLMIYLGMETKKSMVPAISLVGYLLLLVVYAIQFILVDKDSTQVAILSFCIAINFLFVLVSYIGYLWIDDIETKASNKKSIDNSLDWLWKKV